MNEYLDNALQELSTAQAEGVPATEDIINSEDGSSWSGSLTGGGTWKLIKNREDSYTTNTRSHS